MSAYGQLEVRFREITRLREIQAISGWDEACMMPPGGGPGRSQALASLATLIHERLADPEIGELLDQARGGGVQLDAWQSANLATIEQEFVEATAVPADLVRANTLATLRCEQAWREARANNDWMAIQSMLEEVVGLARQVADALADAMGLTRYDALLETYEPDLSAARHRARIRRPEERSCRMLLDTRAGPATARAVVARRSLPGQADQRRAL